MNESEETQTLIEKKISGEQSAKCLLITVICVCFTFSGINSILAVYFSTLGLSQTNSGLLTNLAFFLNYGIAIVGGILADSYIGHYKNLILGILISAVGMGMFILSELGFKEGSNFMKILGFLACFFFVLGNGIMKPSNTAFLGDQFTSTEGEIRSTYFSWFYLVVQIGSIVSTLAIPIVFQYLPTWITFVILGTMAIITIPVFILPRNLYTKRIPKGNNIFMTFIQVIGTGMFGDRCPQERHWLDKSCLLYGFEVVEDVKKSLKVLNIFVLLTFFWGVYFQMYSMWVFLASSMNRTFTIHEKTFTIPSAEVLSLNPIIDCLLIPLSTKIFYPFFENTLRIPLSPLRKIGLGILFTAGALLIAGFVQLTINNHSDNTINIVWIIPQFFLVSCAEVLLSVTGYEFAYTEAPTNMKGIMAALYLLTIASGNILVIIVQIITISNTIMYFIMSGFMVGVFFIFLFISRSYNYTK